MALLPAGPFDAVNDIETAQGAPVSEALAQKLGTNDNDADARSTSNDTDIATNATDITAIKVPNVVKSSGSGTFTVSTGEVQITNFSVALTASRTGIAAISWESDDSGITGARGLTGATITLRLKKNAATIHTFIFITTSTDDEKSFSFDFIDTAAGTGANTYTITGQSNNVSAFEIRDFVMVARELF